MILYKINSKVILYNVITLLLLTGCGLPEIPDLDPYVMQVKNGVGIKCSLVDKEKLEFKCDPNSKIPIASMNGYFAISAKQTSEVIAWIRNAKENYKCEPK